MNSGNNSEYYKQKYLKYKFKYLKLQKGGVIKLGTEECPKKIGFLDSRKTALKLMEEYNCRYEDLRKLDIKKIKDIQTKDIDDVEIIKKLKSIGFPFDFFYDRKVDSKKLLKAGFPLKNFIEKGLSILKLYALLKDDKQLLYTYNTLASFHSQEETINYLLSLLRDKRPSYSFDFLKKILSISNLKELLRRTEGPGQMEWATEQIIGYYEDDVKKKLRNEIPLEEKDNTVRFRHVGKATDFKKVGFTLDNLRGEFTEDELREAGFTI
jgi:hypothetical protein